MGPMEFKGYLLVVISVLFFLSASYAVFFSALVAPSGILLLDHLAADNHYKYLALLLVPTGAYFVIANWVGWQYYRNA
ncbi:hypothetical protein BS47DRAFT_11115 [Hydnum rufescens UP504]|uniref:Uncharacterized protein n=1 Tax=Hydnum rufescens UP504 TaxID=1448309 RepID=A0A9P6E2F1_9AGAM|nr:hypothetical protein BS47DRAFT_11115 [Hydnum rufescens UP504]